MDKKTVIFCTIVALVMLSMAVFLWFNSEHWSAHNAGLIQMPTPFTAEADGHGPRYSPVYNLIGGLCALLLVGYLFWTCYRKFETDSHAEQMAKANSLYNISLATGRTEYELFKQSAEDWSVSGRHVERDFKSYMADQVMPYYAQDFVRKNQMDIRAALLRKNEVKPSSWWDWAKALLVFPGSVLMLFLMGAFMA
jgi:hypothetical protein